MISNRWIDRSITNGRSCLPGDSRNKDFLFFTGIPFFSLTIFFIGVLLFSRSTSNFRTVAIVLAFIAIFVIIAFGFFSMRHRKLKEYYEEKQKKADKKPGRKTFMSPARTGRKVVRKKIRPD